MARFLSEDEKALYEDLLNRVLDVEESDASSGLALVKKQAHRILELRKKEEVRTEEWRAKEEAKKAIGNVIVKKPAGATV